jgi:hypothetical protein
MRPLLALVAGLLLAIGQDELARSWLGGRLGIGPLGLELRLATRDAAPLAAALGRVLPARARIAFHGQIVCVRIGRTNAYVQPLSCR